MPDTEISVPAQENLLRRVQFICMDRWFFDPGVPWLYNIHLLPQQRLSNDILKMQMMIDKSDIDLMILQHIIKFIGIMGLHVEIHDRIRL